MLDGLESFDAVVCGLAVACTNLWGCAPGNNPPRKIGKIIPEKWLKIYSCLGEVVFEFPERDSPFVIAPAGMRILHSRCQQHHHRRRPGEIVVLKSCERNDAVEGWDMVSHGGFIAYYRVSIGKQARSGLGIEAQRQAVATYLNGGNWRIIAEFTEIESGKRSDPPARHIPVDAPEHHRRRVKRPSGIGDM